MHAHIILRLVRCWSIVPGCRASAFAKAAALAQEAVPERLAGVQEAWGSHELVAGRASEAVQHFREAGALGKAAGAALQAGDVGLAGTLLDQLVRASSAIRTARKLHGPLT